eukprot:GHVN01063857.1.p1 GENE.GHVN01063857.1~~GHVN01063857.1.p1  ORF type:complete len:230 (+),score=42.35 GHVN01063857.1:140-829(+)
MSYDGCKGERGNIPALDSESNVISQPAATIAPWATGAPTRAPMGPTQSTWAGTSAPWAATAAPWGTTQAAPARGVGVAVGSARQPQAAPPPPPTASEFEEPEGFSIPQKRISNQADLQQFLISEAHIKYKAFVALLSDSVKGKPYDDSTDPHLSELNGPHFSERVRSIRQMLKNMESWLDEFPPIKESMRFGNQAFQQFHQKLIEVSNRVWGSSLTNCAGVYPSVSSHT